MTALTSREEMLLSALKQIAAIGHSQFTLDLNKKVGDESAAAYEHQHIARAAIAKAETL